MGIKINGMASAWLVLLSILFFNASCSNIPDEKEISSVSPKSYQNETTAALEFCKSNKYNTDYFLLIDLSIHSGLKRLFVYDFKQKAITDRFLVSHGCCNNPWSSTWSKSAATVSNKDGSHCSSIGKYTIGERGYSSWGIHIKYLMHGLDASNGNALRREIVFHSWEEVGDEEIYPKGTPEGWGCPAVSNNTMKLIDQKLKNASSKVLMWVIQ